MRAIFCIAALLTLSAVCHPAAAQWSVTEWVETPIDERVTVKLPYVAEAERDPKVKGTLMYTTDTENIILLVAATDLRYQPGYNPNAAVTAASLSNTFDRIVRGYLKSLRSKEFKALDVRLLGQDNTLFAGMPARAARFSCLDDVRQQPAYLDVIYAWRGEVLYFFGSLYRLPATAETLADKKQFLESVRFGSPPPTQEL